MAKRILLVDDNSDIVALLEHDLKKHGYEVVAAGDGDEGVRKVEEENPDLVLLDVKMPKMGADEVIVRIKKMKPALPVVVYSGYVESENVQRHFIEMGAQKVLSKSIKRDDLLKELDDILQPSQSG